jgi:hypothetical protein
LHGFHRIAGLRGQRQMRQEGQQAASQKME